MGHGFEQRKKVILETLARDGSLLVKEFAAALGISETTVRRDLNELDSLGLLKQVYGGAVRLDTGAVGMSGLNLPVSKRSTHQIEAKRVIGRAAADLVHDGDIVYIDPGTTSWEMIPYLRAKRNLTIISNSVRLLQCLDHIGHHEIIQLGGTLRKDRLDTVGTLAQLCIEQLRGYKAFQGGDGIDIGFGLSAVDHESALMAKIILGNAREICVLADHTKFENPSMLYKITDVDKIHRLVTDRPLAPEWEAACRTAGVDVIVAADPKVE
jgi:DeoR family transcriptional regulator, fructose operon transcriptional repressor